MGLARPPAWRCLFLVALFHAAAFGQQAVRAYEGTLTIPTYVHSVRETEPPLFTSSAVTGLYPFTTYLGPFQPDGPKPRTYRAVFLENEYLKLTHLPDFGGRIFSVYDKLRNREMFYRNDVIKPAHYNPRYSWIQSGLELTGPYDAHMLTLNGEPFWSYKVAPRADGSVSLVMGEIDPVYRMKVNLSATLHPGVAALEMSVFCYNGRDARMPQMFWISTSLPGTPKTQFIYPMTRTIGHTTSEIAEWPVHNGVDYGWDRNNRNMLGVFGIDIYDDFQGAYHHDLDYGVFRYADRRIVQGMKMWTFGYGPAAKNLERGYTDNAGPYVEVQSGRHVWDGHYEWVEPHKAEQWSEWWIPVAGIGGLTTVRRDAALHLEILTDSRVRLALSPVCANPGATITVSAHGREISRAVADLVPGKPFLQTIPAGARDLQELVVEVTGAGGRQVLRYARPDSSPGRKEYTPFTRPLEKPAKPLDEMGAEELVLAAEFKLKELNAAAGLDLLNKALARDSGFARAHLLLGIHHFTGGRHHVAASHLEKAIARDPYLDEAYYYLALSQFALGREEQGERNLHFIWPGSARFGEREYHLGRLAFQKKRFDAAVKHLERAIAANGFDLNARLLLAVTLRQVGDRPRALAQLSEIEHIDPTNRTALAERHSLGGDAAARKELGRLLGGQSQEALEESLFYCRLERWGEAADLLRTVETDNHDPFGTPPEFYYTFAYYLKRAGASSEAAECLRKARAARGRVDRFPYRAETEAPLAEALKADPGDGLARFLMGCLLYHLERPAEAIEHWEAAVRADQRSFPARRALGLAYAEQGRPVEAAAAQLEAAVEINPAHVQTFNDLSSLYARAGRFDEQLVLVKKALARSPQDDNLAEAVLTASLAKGRYDEAEKLVTNHRFAPRHRVYTLRDKYRILRFGQAAAAYHRSDFSEALRLFESAMKPPVSLGVDDFASQSTPRMEYYAGRVLDALGKGEEARQAYRRAIQGLEHLSGDRDSLNSENFHMVLALDRLGRGEEAARIEMRMVAFARAELDSKVPRRRAEARYLLALAQKRAGRGAEARRSMEEAIGILPDFLLPRLELRGDVLDPLR